MSRVRCGERVRPLLIAWLIVGGLGARAARAEEPVWIGPPAEPLMTEQRAGGVLEHSFQYHRQPPMTPATTHAARVWYGYGFPVKTYRWGWFGAAHYDPTVLWHRGYMGDAVRVAYRRGY